MKKITIMAALLMGSFMANAQVGIGTPEPHESAELDIVAKNGKRGILIPRVELIDQATFAMEGTEVDAESLLVFHTGNQVMAKGFYYWSENKWNKIVAGADLSDNLVTMQGDMSDVRDLLNYIAPSYPGHVDADGNHINSGSTHSTVVFDTTDKNLYMVTYENDAYKRTSLDFDTLVADAETETIMKVVDATGTDGKKFVYFSEKAIQEWLGVEGNVIADIPADKGVTIDIVGEMKTSNALFFADQNVITAIETISLKAEGNVIYKNVAADGETPNFVIQYFENGAAKSVTFEELVATAEVDTKMLAIKGAKDKTIGYRYFNEVAVKDFLAKNPGKTEADIVSDSAAAGSVDLNVVSDVIDSFGEILVAESKEDKEDGKPYKVNELIAKYMNSIENVYYGDLSGKLTFYTVDATGKKIEVDLTFISTAINDQLSDIQDILGETLSPGATEPVKTGDIFKGDEVLKFMGTMAIAKNSAKTDGITVQGNKDVQQVLGIELYKDGKFITSSVTDIKISGKKIDFNIGTGNVYYNITNNAAAVYEVVVKYAVTKDK